MLTTITIPNCMRPVFPPDGVAARGALRQTKVVPERCTCGAFLPPDARFCHKCGKPQIEEAVEPEAGTEPSGPEVSQAAEAQPTPPMQPHGAPPEIGFHNRLAVKTALLVASISFLMSSLMASVGFLPLQLLIMVGLSVAGGFLAAYLYSRRSGQNLTIIGGARIGWITGIFSFVINLVMMALLMAMIAAQGGLAGFLEKHSSAAGLPQETVDQMIEAARNPSVLVVVIGFALLVQFFTYAILTSLGGALGAKVLERD